MVEEQEGSGTTAAPTPVAIGSSTTPAVCRQTSIVSVPRNTLSRERHCVQAPRSGGGCVDDIHAATYLKPSTVRQSTPLSVTAWYVRTSPTG